MILHKAESINKADISINNDYISIAKGLPQNNECAIPSSKPETQRGIIIASLASGTSFIKNDLRCLETETMKRIMTSLGAKITEHNDYLEIEGIGGKIKYDNQVLDCLGSGLAFRVVSALSCISEETILVTGDASLRPRVMKPLLDTLNELGANVESLVEKGKAPIVSWNGDLKGGKVELDGDISSQFITALLIVAPLTPKGIHLKINKTLLSRSYIKQTIHFMEIAGIKIECDDAFENIVVYPGEYHSIDVTLSGDMTSSSYFLALCTMFKGTYKLSNMPFNSMQGERYFLDVIEELGIKLEFDENTNELTLINEVESLEGNYHFDVENCPNIIPTLAALGAYVKGHFKVTGGSITRLHKCNRIKAMVSELSELGVDIQTIYKDDIEDGFLIKGRDSYAGGKVLSSWGDHRIFMSLFIASLRMDNNNHIDGYKDVICSFPDFFKQVENIMGVSYASI